MKFRGFFVTRAIRNIWCNRRRIRSSGEWRRWQIGICPSCFSSRSSYVVSLRAQSAGASWTLVDWLIDWLSDLDFVWPICGAVFFLFWSELIRKHGKIIQSYHIQYLGGYDAGLLTHLMQVPVSGSNESSLLEVKAWFWRLWFAECLGSTRRRKRHHFVALQFIEWTESTQDQQRHQLRHGRSTGHSNGLVSRSG